MKNKKKAEKEVAESPKELLFIADVKCNAVWKNITGTYQSSKGLFIGKFKVAGYHFDGGRPKGDPLTYKVTSPIDNIKSNLGNYATIEECEAVCLQVAKAFCNLLGRNI